MILWAHLAAAEPVDVRVLARGSGEPLAAEVRVGGATHPTDGRLLLDLPPGAHVLEVEAWDYVPARVEVTVPVEEPVRIWLSALPAPLEVVVESFKATPHASRHVVDAEMALETPGTLDDSVRLVQSLPGVAVSREYSPGQAEISVRGSGPGDNRYLLDGVEIPYLYHFNQYASVVPTTELSQLELFPSTFGAAYGDAVGAVVSATTTPEPPKALHGSAHLNYVMAGGSLAAPLPKGWWIAASGRRSYQDLAGSATPQYTLWPVFHDFSVRAGRGGTTVHAWGAGDRYDRAAGELDLLDPAEQAVVPSFSYRRAFEVLSVQHRWDAGRVVAAVVDDRLSGALTGNGEERLHTLWAQTRGDLRHPISDALSVEGGWELRGERARMVVEGPGPAAILVASEAPGLARGVAVDATAWRLRSAAWAELHARAGTLRAIPGLRVGSDTMGAPVVAEPRLALRWRVADQTELELGAGLYHQAPDTEHLLAGPLPVARSWQLAAGIEQTFAARLEVELNGYAKALERPLVTPVDGAAFAGERGLAWGGELVTRYRLRETFFVWGWLAVARTSVDGAPADGDQPVSGGMVSSWDAGRGWNLGLRYRFGSGLPFTPIEGSVYDATRDAWIPVPGDENGARFPAYHKVDLHVAKTWTFQRWALTLAAEVWYVPEASAQLYPAWSYDYREQGWVRGPTLLPLLGARATF